MNSISLHDFFSGFATGHFENVCNVVLVVEIDSRLVLAVISVIEYLLIHCKNTVYRAGAS